MTQLKDALNLMSDGVFVSIREIQKSPTRALDGFKIILNNGKMQGIYIPQEEIDEYVEDLQALSSEGYIQMIQQARSEKTISSKEVWSSLDV